MNIDISNFSNYLYKKIGIDIDNKNIHYLENFLQDKKNLSEKMILDKNLSENFDLIISQDKLQTLINKLTINETYFFRDNNHIDFIKSFIEKNISSKGLVIWSMGCSSGEEAYTIALLLKDIGLLDNNIPIKIYGFDINTDFLDIARKANYSSWSFRGMEKKYEKYFNQISEDNYIIDSQIKQSVSFIPFNIKEDIFTPDLTSIYGIPNLILCRNTLMYFNRTEIKRIVARFSELLNNNGFIISGAQELNLFKSDKLNMKQINNAFVFTKIGTDIPGLSKQKFIKVVSEPDILNNQYQLKKGTFRLNPISLKVNQKNKSLEEAPVIINKAIEVLDSKTFDCNLLLYQAIKLINQNDYIQGLKLCDKVLAYNKDEYIAYYLKSFSYFLTDEMDKASDNIEKALLLKANSALLHYSYSNILIKKEFCAKVIYHLKKAKSLIDKEDDRILEITEISKSELKKCINTALNNLEVINE